MQPADTLEEPYFFRGQSDAFMWGLPFWEHVLYTGVYSIEKPVWWSRWTDESHYKNDTIVRSQTRTNIRAWHILLQRSIPNELCTFTPRRHAAEWTAAISHISGSDVWSESVSHWASQHLCCATMLTLVNGHARSVEYRQTGKSRRSSDRRRVSSRFLPDHLVEYWMHE